MTKKEIKAIIKELKDDVKSCKKQNQSKDAASWGYEEGVLITWGTAEKIIFLLKVHT